MVFENAIEYGEAAAQALVEVGSRALLRKSFLIRRTAALAVGLVCLICGSLLLLSFGQMDAVRRIVCVGDLILGASLLGRGIFLRRSMVRRVMRSMSGGIRRIVFTEDEIRVEQPGVQESVFYYPVVTAFYETEGYFVLPLSTKVSVLLDKGGFTQGTVPEFRAFLRERTGKTAQFVSGR